MALLKLSNTIVSSGNSKVRPSAPFNSNSKKDSDDDFADNIVICEILRNRRVTVRTWQGKVAVDIHEYYNKDGKQLPGKKGPFFSLSAALFSVSGLVSVNSLSAFFLAFDTPPQEQSSCFLIQG
ncbi:RNA polymerase II transcriptional coactivator KIWI-like [Quercus robur]|uniref:RNA polymerase II transcriptional coactivator KIWI-like n=1 Tax=Quercus robur TaxID=38942 RepID=UPI002161D7FE|nr:RNA polymerase II transcriptional coactivator KIWI-like [Quercus robur]